MYKVNLAEYKDCFTFREIFSQKGAFEVDFTEASEEDKKRMLSALQGIACLSNGDMKALKEDCYQMIPGMTYIGDILSMQTMDKMSFVIQTKEDLNLAAETLKSGHPVCVDLSQMLKAEARKAFDYLSVIDYYLDGQLNKLEENVFLYIPEKKVYAESDDPVIIEHLDRTKALYQEEKSNESWMQEFAQAFTSAVNHMKENQIISPVALIYAQLLEEMGKTDAAIDVLKDYADWCETGSMHFHEYYVLALLKLGTYYYRKKAYEDIEKYVKPLLNEEIREKLSVIDNDFHLRIYVEALIKNGRRDEAKKYVKATLQESKSEREQAQLKAKLAELYAEEGIFWKAAGLYKESISLAESLNTEKEKKTLLINAKIDLAGVYSLQGKVKNEIACLEEAKVLCETDQFPNLMLPMVYLKLANCYAKIKKSDDAIRNYESLIQWHEDGDEKYTALVPVEVRADAYRYLGEQLFEQEKFAEAAKAFEKAMEIYRGNSKNMYSYAKEILFLQEYIVKLLELV